MLPRQLFLRAQSSVRSWAAGKLHGYGFGAKRFRQVWLFMDRDTQADDNAEHLYRYVIGRHPGVNCHFVLRRSSPDWNRLKEEGLPPAPFWFSDALFGIAQRSAPNLISSR
jgi:hypothetical protein